MRVREVYIDIDDTLNTLTLDTMRKFGADISSYYDYPDVGYNIIRATDVCGGKVPKLESGEYDEPAFWDAVTLNSVWLNTSLSLDAMSIIYRCVASVGKENVCVATRPTKCGQCHAQKVEWIERFLPPWIHRQYFLTPRKYKLGQPGALLIDDCEENCEMFRKRHGEAILYPRPWNTAWGDFSKDIFDEQMNELLGAN